jgi:hypothetical protein
MNGINSNLALVDSSKSFRVSNKVRENDSGKGSPLKRSDVVNKYTTKLNSKLSPMDQIDELGLSMEKIYTRSIGKRKSWQQHNRKQFFNHSSKKKQICKLKRNE